MNILSIDPGMTIGLAYSPTYVTVSRKDHDGFLKDLYNGMMICRERNEKWTVICEAFYGSGRSSKYGNATIKLIGGIHAICLVLGIPLVMQAPQSRKAYLEEAAKITETEHQKDAMAHLLAYEAKNAK